MVAPRELCCWWVMALNGWQVSAMNVNLKHRRNRAGR
jgi:hypothetical protein